MQKKHFTNSIMKNISKGGRESNFLNLIKGIYEKPIANIIVVKDTFLSKIKNKARMANCHFYSAQY